jgi:hypothetical protein
MRRRAIIDPHAHKQFCSRVEPIDIEELKQRVQEQLDQGNFRRSKRGHSNRRFIHVDGVWWVFRENNNVMIFITCYGRGTMDLPRALIWAEKHNDRINLNDLIRPMEIIP